ncbi:uncharacterized protein DS421_16g548660 [Arachis hypogaea]|nr:uncharacterized protein DS421_16g548660 [Arachis hypogaea]
MYFEVDHSCFCSMACPPSSCFFKIGTFFCLFLILYFILIVLDSTCICFE